MDALSGSPRKGSTRLNNVAPPPPPSLSPSRAGPQLGDHGVAAAGEDIAQDTTELEDMEQRMIQRVKTAGLRADREAPLLDGLLDLRRRRRRVTSALLASRCALEEERDTLRRRLSVSIAGAEKLEREMDEMVSARVRDVQGEHDQRFREYSSRRDAALKQFAKDLRDKYEAQVGALEKKLGEVGEEMRRVSEPRLQEAQRVQGELAAAREEAGRQSQRAQRYKAAVVTLTQREADLEAQARAAASAATAAAREREQMQLQIQSLEAALNENVDRAIASKKSLLAKLDAIQEAHQQELAEARRREAAAREGAEAAEARHAAELARADERVRRALASRDAEIERLEARLRSAEARAVEAEAAIRDLHEGL